MEPTAATLIEPLIRATEAGTVRWEEDATGGYKTGVGASTINVYTMPFLDPSTGSNHPSMHVSVLDPQGKAVDWVTFVGAERLPAERLYTLAQRQVRNVDTVLTDILSRLEAPPRPSP